MSTLPPVGRTFAHLLANTAVAGLTTSFLWFALTFWAYLETRSVLATGVIGGAYMLFVSVSSIMFGSVVDHHRKIVVMRVSTVTTLALFIVAGLFYTQVPGADLTDLSQPWFWIFAVLILVGSIVEHMRNIALSTCVTILVPEDQRDRANGLVGTAQGITFLATSVLSGLSIGFLGMGWTLVLATVLVGAGLVHLLLVRMPQEPVPTAAGSDDHGRVDLRGSIAVIAASAGLFALIFFSTFNNFVGGVYMALMDPYGLEMFQVEVWGLVLGACSVGFIVGGGLVAKFGLGPRPVRTMLLGVVAMGALGSLFTIRELAWLYVVGIFLYMCLIPLIEAAEQTIIQRVVPLERQGRVFGFAMAVETAAAPLTAFLIAPIASEWIIPFAASEPGQLAIEPLVGSGTPVSRGIALVFLGAGLIMVVVAVLALFSPAYRALSATYAKAVPPPAATGGAASISAGMVSTSPGEVVGSASAAAALTLPGQDERGVTEPDPPPPRP
ncbi:MFS transporter [Ornithinimicrobium sp. F0845]|uniref:MFS transporter n=1 Tax=Ornithinimicrobium sp. F0845 TaxID=2926412 RepID=UPI001FF2C353|nr:MFS transporter [Ornithinimicrobium sp. F0845]MCK0110670.1 MFS transporter [Ornithinimicrobium sp. F0845]